MFVDVGNTALNSCYLLRIIFMEIFIFLRNISPSSIAHVGYLLRIFFFCDDQHFWPCALGRMRPSSKQALERNKDWPVLGNVNNINEKYAFFNSIIIMSIDTVMPSRIIKFHTNDAPRMTGHLKHLIRLSL